MWLQLAPPSAWSMVTREHEFESQSWSHFEVRSLAAIRVGMREGNLQNAEAVASTGHRKFLRRRGSSEPCKPTFSASGGWVQLGVAAGKGDLLVLSVLT